MAVRIQDTSNQTVLIRLKKKRRQKGRRNSLKGKKSLMSTWEDLDSCSSDSKEEASIDLMADVADNSMLEDSDNEVHFNDIDNLHLAYQEAISNNGMIA